MLIEQRRTALGQTPDSFGVQTALSPFRESRLNEVSSALQGITTPPTPGAPGGSV